ncbi:MAG: hypothetical protein JWN46_1360 [Acidimicrobiales bacterium]|nr:hypothetical protein [Acidimicrobiales bacterium]
MVIKDNGGRVLDRAKIVLIFRGPGWISGTPSSSAASTVFGQILASPFMSDLVQYRGIRRPVIVSTRVDTSSIGTVTDDPRHILSKVTLVSDSEVRQAVIDAVNARPAPAGEQTLYMVLVSADPLPVYAEQNNACGYHSAFQSKGTTLIYGTTLNWSARTAFDAWATSCGAPSIFVHEVAEAVTDPQGSGFTLPSGTPLKDTDAGEICDILAPGGGRDARIVAIPGVTVNAGLVMLNAYWSELRLSGDANDFSAHAVPTTYSLRVALRAGVHTSVPSVRGSITGSSVRTAILSQFNP